jgi:glucosylceramidase
MTEWICTTEQKPWARRKLTAAAGRTANLQPNGRIDQTWEGFGGCFNELGWIELKQLPSGKRAKVLEALFDTRAGCGFTIARMPIGASDYAAEWYSHNEHAGDLAMRHFSIARDRDYLLPYIRSALQLQPALTLFASPWSPPTWLKHPRAYNYGKLIWEPAVLRAYALYFVKFVQAYAREGVTIRQIHPQNEPVADQKFPSCLWSGDQLREFIRGYLGPAFARAGLDTEIWLGTLNTADYDGYVNAVLSDPRAHKLIAGVGFQWDGRGAIQRAHAAWPEKRMMQTENECGDGRNTWAYARYIFNLMQHYIANGVNAYIYWNMVLAPGGASTWGWKQNAMVSVDGRSGSIVYNPEYYVMKHFARFIRPGARRLELSGPLCANAVAFENPDGRRVIVAGNPLSSARELEYRDERGAWRATLPPESYNTFVAGRA